MKKLFLIVVLFALCSHAFSQQVNGTILSDSGNLMVVKIWGTHTERGFAYGYLCGAKIKSIYDGYFLPNYGSFLSLAHGIILAGTQFKIDSVYFDEAKAVVAGMDSAGIDVSNLDYIDLIASNCLLDMLGLAKEKFEIDLGCSSLMSWGAATLNTDLNGHSSVTRHLDWSNSPNLIANQIMVVHLPSESNEQPWVMIGFAGQISALSGVNQYFGTFQHMMSDFSGSAVGGTLYEPIWFSLRKALELKDANSDGFHDARDVHDILNANSNGYADGYIICTMAKSTAGSCDRIAEVAEIAPASPFLVFRSNDFPDTIPTDNLYAANYEIKRNDHYHFCTRYNNVVNNMGNGDSIGSQENWDIMKNYSVSLSPQSNVQMIQYIPEDGILRISVHKHGKPAYQNSPDSWNLTDLFTNPAGIEIEPVALSLSLWPDPARETLHIRFYTDKKGKCRIRIFDLSGKLILAQEDSQKNMGTHLMNIDLKSFKPGIYLIHLDSPEGPSCGRFMIAD
jgi:hypothetical protein